MPMSWCASLRGLIEDTQKIQVRIGSPIPGAKDGMRNGRRADPRDLMPGHRWGSGQMRPEWCNVETAADVERLLSTFGEFHDGCLREVHIWTETSVDDDLTMTCPGYL